MTMTTGQHSRRSRLVAATQRIPPLVVFLLGSVVLGSLATGLVARIPASPQILPLVALPISYLPALLAMLLVRRGNDVDGRRAFQRRLTTWRVHWPWYVVAALAGPVAHAAGVALATMWGGTYPLQLKLLALLPLFLINNLGEEIGWRGYALPRLLHRFSSLTSSLIIGVCWAAFHWVALAQNPTRPGGYLAVGSVFLIAMSIVMTWVFNRTGSVVLMVLFHAAYDVVAIGVIPLAGTGQPLLAFALTAAVMSLAAVLLIVIAGPELGRLSSDDVGASN